MIHFTMVLGSVSPLAIAGIDSTDITRSIVLIGTLDTIALVAPSIGIHFTAHITAHLDTERVLVTWPATLEVRHTVVDTVMATIIMQAITTEEDMTTVRLTTRQTQMVIIMVAEEAVRQLHHPPLRSDLQLEVVAI